MEWKFLLGVAPGTDHRTLGRLLRGLPSDASAVHDDVLNVVAVVVNGGADHANETLRVMSQSGLFTASVEDDAAIVKYMPHQASQPADWDVLEDDWAICTTCSWSTNRRQTQLARDAEMKRHTAAVHGGRSA